MTQRRREWRPLPRCSSGKIGHSSRGEARTALAHAQCQTIRLTLLKIGARIRITVRHVWLALATGCPYAALFARVHATLRRC